MLRPSCHRSQRARLRGSPGTRVTTSVPVVRIHAFKIERAVDNFPENFVVGKVRSKAAQVV